MITLMLTEAQVLPFDKIIGYILSGLEIFSLLVYLLHVFVPPETKFAKILEFIFKGLKQAKTGVLDFKDGKELNIENKSAQDEKPSEEAEKGGNENEETS